jgi:hypothetical protein
MKIVLCGSLSLCDEILKIKGELERRGHEVFLPEAIIKFSLRSAEDVDAFKSPKTNYTKIKPIYMRGHFDKIAKSDAILVVNKTKRGIENYIGGNTFAEIMVAFFLDKKIFLLNPIPTHESLSAFREEIEGVHPIVLNGSLDDIK